MTNTTLWRGIVALVKDGVEHGSRAVERVQIETARRTFTILEHVAPIAGPTRLVHSAHDASVAVVHTVIRTINAAVGSTVDAVLEQAEHRPPGDNSAITSQPDGG